MSSGVIADAATHFSPLDRLLALRISRVAAVLGALTGLAAVVRFTGIGHQSYWYDEAHTVWLLHLSPGSMFTQIQSSETSPPAYFLIAWPWAHVFGYGPVGLRSLSALAGVVTVPVAYAAGAQFFSRRAGLIVAALTACSPLLIWYSQEARSYACMILFTSVALLAFAHLRADPSRRWAVIWAFAATLAMWTHYYSALALVPQGLWLFARYRHIRGVRLALEAVVACCSALIPLALMQLKVLAASSWIGHIPLAHRVAQVPVSFVVGPEAIAGTWLTIIGAIVVVISIASALRGADGRERQSIVIAARITGGGFAIVIALIVFGYDQLDYRNMLALWLPVALVVAGALGLKRANAVRIPAVVALCALGIATAVGVAVDPRLQRPDWRAVARKLGEGPERAIFLVNGCQLLPLSLYVHGLQFAPPHGVAVKAVDVISASNENSWTRVLDSGWYVACLPSQPGATVPGQLGVLHESDRPVRINQFTVTRLSSTRSYRLTKRTFAAAGLRGVLMVQRPDNASQPTNGSTSP